MTTLESFFQNFDAWLLLPKDELAACPAKLLGFTEGVPNNNIELKKVTQGLYLNANDKSET